MKKTFEFLESQRVIMALIKLSIVIVITILHVLMWNYVGMHHMAMVTAIVSGLLTLVLISEHRIENKSVLVNLILTLIFLLIADFILATYNSSFVASIWLILFPLSSLIFLNKKGFVFWSSLVFVFYLLTPYLASIFPIQDPIPLAYKSTIENIEIGALILVNTIFIYLYRKVLFQALKSSQSRGNELKKSRAELKKNQKSMDDFFSNISHELRTPLHAIAGVSELMEPESERNKELLQYIRKSSQHLENLVNDLMDYAQIKQGLFSLTPAIFNPRETLSMTLGILQPIAKQRDIKLRLKLKGQFAQKLEGDPHRLSQIIINIISNAIKYSHDGGNILIEIRGELKKENKQEINRFSIIIRDYGLGITVDDLDVVFEDYARGESSIKKQLGGIGLGLFITKYLVEAMGGNIGIDSEVKKGTQVNLNLSFPVKQKIEKKSSKNRIENLEKIEMDLNILVVDDNHFNRVVAQKQLEKILSLDSTVFTAVNGEEALQVYQNNRIDMILMDIEMPVMNGLEATKKIRCLKQKDKNNVPIIAVSANVSEQRIQDCLQNGMDMYITKPVSITKLHNSIQEALASHTI